MWILAGYFFSITKCGFLQVIVFYYINAFFGDFSGAHQTT